MVAKTATLVDDFSANDTTKWPVRAGSTVTIAGTASLACTSTFTVLGSAAGAYDLTSSSIYCQIVQVPQAGAQSWLRVANEFTTGFNDVSWLIDNLGLHALLRVAGSANSEVVISPFDPVAHKWLRIRDNGTQLLWDTSPDGTTWTNRRTITRTLVLSASTVELNTTSYDSTVRQPFVVDNMNTLGTVAQSATGTTSGVGSTSGTVRVALTGATSGAGTSQAIVTGAARTVSGTTTAVGSSTTSMVRVVLSGASSGAGATSGTAAGAGVYIPTIGLVHAGTVVIVTPVVVGLTVNSLTWTCNQPGFAFTQAANGELRYIAPTTTQGVSVVWTLTAVISTGAAPSNDTAPPIPPTTQTVTVTHNILRHTGPWMVGSGGIFYPLYVGGGTFTGATPAGPAFFDLAIYDIAFFEA